MFYVHDNLCIFISKCNRTQTCACTQITLQMSIYTKDIFFLLQVSENHHNGWFNLKLNYVKVLSLSQLKLSQKMITCNHHKIYDTEIDELRYNNQSFFVDYFNRKHLGFRNTLTDSLLQSSRNLHGLQWQAVTNFWSPNMYDTVWQIKNQASNEDHLHINISCPGQFQVRMNLLNHLRT